MANGKTKKGPHDYKREPQYRRGDKTLKEVAFGTKEHWKKVWSGVKKFAKGEYNYSRMGKYAKKKQVYRHGGGLEQHD